MRFSGGRLSGSRKMLRIAIVRRDGGGEEHRELEAHRREQAADGRADHHADAREGAEQAEPLGPLLGRGDVGEVGEQRGQVAGGEALDDAGEHEHPDGAADAEQGHRERGAEGGADDDGPTTEAVGQPAEERGDQEGAQAVDRLEHADPDGEVALVATRTAARRTEARGARPSCRRR